MSALAKILEGDDYVPSPAPSADTSAFAGPAAQEPTPGDFIEDISEKIFHHLADNHPEIIDTPAMVSEVDAFLAELRERLVAV